MFAVDSLPVATNLSQQYTRVYDPQMLGKNCFWKIIEPLPATGWCILKYTIHTCCQYIRKNNISRTDQSCDYIQVIFMIKGLCSVYIVPWL